MDPTAVMGRRIGAWLIDGVIAVAVFVIALFSLGERETAFFDPCGFDSSPTLCFYGGETVFFAEGGTAALIISLPYLVGIGFAWILQGATGGTPGKLMVGLRVVDQNTGQLAGYGKSLGRTLMWIVDAIPFVVPLVGLITGLATKGHRRVGDMAAKTLVVDKRQVGTPPLVAGLTAPEGAYSPMPPGQYAPPPGHYAPPPGQYAPPPPGAAPAPPGAAAPPMAPVIPPPAPTPPVQPAAAEPAPAEADGVSAPKWDPDRNAYIQWDPELQAWMQFDDGGQRWVPISQ